MNSRSWLRQELSRWLNNGANLITLSRLPMLLCVQWALIALTTDLLPARLPWTLYALGVVSTWGMLLVWDCRKPLALVGWTAAATALIAWLLATASNTQDPSDLSWGRDALFVFLTCVQAIGMITDGLDGRYARKRSRNRRGSSEGQFLDQCIDKVFVWTTWFVLTGLFWWMARGNWGACGMLFIWSVASLYLFWLDARSCYKHWRNYLADRGKEFNKNSGAVRSGKWKFGMENVSICAGMLALIPLLNVFGIRDYSARFAQYLAGFLLAVSCVALWSAIALARSSLRARGVLKSRAERREEKLIAKHRPSLPADAVVDTDS